MITEITEGEGISVVTTSGKVVVTNTMPNRNAFTTVEILGQTAISSKRHGDTVVLSAGKFIKISTDPSSNNIIFAVDTSDLTGNFIGDLEGDVVSANILKVSSNNIAVKQQQTMLVNQYASLQEDATGIRKNILALQDQLAYWQHVADPTNNLASIQVQIFQKESELLDIDKQISVISTSLKLLELSLSDTSATFTYDPFSMVLTSNRTLATPLVLQNVTNLQRNSILNPASGRMIYNTSVAKVQAYADNKWVDLH